MSLKSPGDLNRLIQQCGGDRQVITERLRAEVLSDPLAVLRVHQVNQYLPTEETRAAIEVVLRSPHPEQYLRYIDAAQHYIPDEQLRAAMIDVHRKHPWVFYSNKDQLARLFPNEFFRRLSDQGFLPLKDPDLFKIFLLYNAQMPLASFNALFQKFIREHCQDDGRVDAYIEDAREPGFACGGMERNFLQAARENHGLCLVNGFLLAKQFHSKGADKAKKVSYVARRTQETQRGYVLWADYVYAPTGGQHEQISQAIAEGTRAIHVPDVAVRPVRPLIGIGSQEIFEAFECPLS